MALVVAAARCRSPAGCRRRRCCSLLRRSPDPELSRPEIWFDCSFSRLLDASASPPFAYASPPYELPCAPSPTTCTGPPLPPVAVPPLPPVAVAVWVLVAVLLLPALVGSPDVAGRQLVADGGVVPAALRRSRIPSCRARRSGSTARSRGCWTPRRRRRSRTRRLHASSPCAPSPTTCTGPPLPPVAVPPLPPVAVAVWVLVAVLLWWHWSLPCALQRSPAACRRRSCCCLLRRSLLLRSRIPSCRARRSGSTARSRGCWTPRRRRRSRTRRLHASRPAHRHPRPARGRQLPAVAVPPLPPVAVAVWVLVAVFSCRHWLAA